jgi:hypothetical protein
MGLRKLFAQFSEYRRTIKQNQVEEIETRCTAPFRPLLESHETIVQFTPARDRGGMLYYLAATQRRLLWYVDGTPDVEAIPYRAVKAFGYDRRARMIFVRRFRLDALEGESPYDDDMWELFPSPMSDQVLEAIRAGLNEAGTLLPATRAFAAMHDQGSPGQV